MTQEEIIIANAMKNNTYFDLIEKNINSKSMRLYNTIQKFYILTNNMFVYENLPEEINKNYLEQELLETGSILFFKHEDKYYVSKFGAGGKLNEYYEPIEFTVANPYIPNLNNTFKFTTDNAVMIKNDHKRLGINSLITSYSIFKTEAETTVNANLIYSRAHKIISATDSDDIEAINKALEGLKNGELKTLTRSSFLTDFQEHELGTPEIDHEKHIKIEQYRKAEFLNTLGISLNEDMGSQYTNTAETDLNNSQTHAYILNMLQSRRDAIERINELWGLEIEVKFNPEWFNKPVEVKEELEPEQEQETHVLESQQQEPKKKSLIDKLKGGE